MAAATDLQSRLEDLLRVRLDAPGERVESVAAAPDAARARRFSAFHLPDVLRANQMASEWMQTANGNGDQAAAVAAVLESAGQAVREMSESPQEDPDLARHALKLFITHHPHGVPLRIPTLEERTPLLALPSKPLPAPGAEAVAEENPEDRLLWLREDPKLNEHHEHWHVVYPIAGVPAPDTERKGKLKERQGELFFYMHRQMLARYDAERLGVGLERVVPWDYADTEPLGYDPGQYLFPTYGSRPPGAWVPTTEGIDQDGKTVIVTTDDMALRGQRLFAAASSGCFDLPDGTRVPVDVNLLGATQEADIGTVEAGVIPFDPKDFGPWYAAIVEGFYGNFHNVGHDMFGWLSTNSTPPNNGIMGFVPTACRDHVFFRWHRLIDTLCTTWQDTQPSNDFSDAPPVTIRKSLPGEPAGQSPDIILCLANDMVPWDRWEEFGTYAFGGDANWDRSFASGSFPSGPNLPTPFTTTGELLTEMRRRVITIETGAEPPAQSVEAPHEIEYLDQDEFFYFLRLENTSAQAQDVTVRVFLVPIEPDDLTEDRVAWIEMDKFNASLAASEKAVVFRPGSLSSVIRKPGVKPPAAEQPPIGPGMQQDALIEANYCDCGWPYNLLLPRGMPDGMHFRLLVMLTDGNIDKVEESSCGSMSFCGARDKYPDGRPMGYPFDRPFRDKTVAETIAAQANMATRDITIRLRS